MLDLARKNHGIMVVCYENYSDQKNAQYFFSAKQSQKI